MQFIISLFYKYYDKGTKKRNTLIHKVHELFFSSSILIYILFSVKVSHKISKESNFKNLKHKFDLTTILLKIILKKYLKKDSTVLEIGTGAFAVLSIFCSKITNILVHATDINKDNVDKSLYNINYNRASVKVYHSNIFENISLKYDIIFWNLPYYYPKNEYLYPLLEKVHNHLNYNGFLIIGYNSNPLKEADIISYLQKNNELEYYKTHKFKWNHHLISVIRKK